MNSPFHNSSEYILSQVQDHLSRSLTGVPLLRALKGIHPIDIKRALLESETLEEAKEAFESIEVTSPTLHEILRDDNPVSSFWPFTRASAETIANMSLGYSSVALLGTPTLFGLLGDRPESRTMLFESDDYFFPEGSVPGYVKCDLTLGLPHAYDDQFDLIVGDPPWYLDEYLTWLEIAVRIARPGGTVIFVLFPEGIRESAKREREAIFSFARDHFESFTQANGIVEYETPSFEQVQMIRNGISPINWRSAEIFTGHVRKTKTRSYRGKRSAAVNEWVERRLGCGRLFIKREPVHSTNFLEFADPRSRFLSSPSRRDAARLRANVITSRGHGLRCNDPSRLISLLDSVKLFSDVNAYPDQMESGARDLLRTVAADLWGRFILI